MADCRRYCAICRVEIDIVPPVVPPRLVPPVVPPDRDSIPAPRPAPAPAPSLTTSGPVFTPGPVLTPSPIISSVVTPIGPSYIPSPTPSPVTFPSTPSPEPTPSVPSAPSPEPAPSVPSSPTVSGSVTIERDREHVFTSLRRPQGKEYDLSITIRSNLNAAVVGVNAIHSIERFNNMGLMGIVPASIDNLPDGSFVLNFNYSRPGTANSLVHITLNLDNGEFVEVQSYIPVNGLTFTEQIHAPVLRFESTTSLSETINIGAAQATTPCTTPAPAPVPSPSLAPAPFPTPAIRPVPVPPTTPFVNGQVLVSIPGSRSQPILITNSFSVPVPVPSPLPVLSESVVNNILGGLPESLHNVLRPDVLWWISTLPAETWLQPNYIYTIGPTIRPTDPLRRLGF